MVAAKLQAFGGMVPATSSRQLPQQAASMAVNTWLYSGELMGVVAPKFVRECSKATTSKSYRIPKNYTDAEHIDDSTWMDFDHVDTDVIRSPIVDDSFDRYYWVSPLIGPTYSTYARIRDGLDPFTLGVIAPTGNVILTTSGGVSGTLVSRAYAATWVNAFGEEGAPSISNVVNDKIDATWTVTMPAAAPSDVSKYNLDKARIYRTVTGSDGTTTYFFVTEVDIAAASYADTASDDVVTANEQIQSTNWTPPPADLIGWVTMPNGMIAGWKNNEIWFCEPYRPHAWPAANTLVVEYPIIGLGVLNQTLVICTSGYPMLATGINPASMTLSKLASFEPCMSRGSVLSTPEGVYYASPNGLVLVQNGAAGNVTAKMVTKDKWNSLLRVGTLRATRLGDAYYTFGSGRFGVFQEDAFEMDAFNDEDLAGSYSGALIDLTSERVAFNILESEQPITNAFGDSWSGETLLIFEGNLYRLDLADPSFARQPFRWRSKEFQSGERKNFAVVRAYFTIPPWMNVPDGPRDTSIDQGLAPDKLGVVRIYADEKLVMARELRTSGEIMRIPSGFKADYWSIEFEANVIVASVQIATSVKELSRA